MSLSQQQQKFSLDVAKLINFIYENGYSCTFGETYRTKEQALIYAKEGKGIIDSLHCQRLAVDLNIFDPSQKLLTNTKDYEKFGIYWESIDPINRWGGKFTRADGDHFERNFKA